MKIDYYLKVNSVNQCAELFGTVTYSNMAQRSEMLFLTTTRSA